MTLNHDNFISPCGICSKQITSGEIPIYCPDCGQLYHLKCWEAKGNRCKVKGCRGDTKVISTSLEKFFLNRIKTNLKSSCTNCGRELLILYQYCPSCGLEVNSPKDQRSLSSFPLLKFLHNRKMELGIGIISVILLFIILVLINGSRSPSLPSTPQVYDYLTPTQIVFIPPPVNNPTITILPTIITTLVPTLAPILVPTSIPQKTIRKTCPGAPPIRVEIGDYTRVVSNVTSDNGKSYIYMVSSPEVGQNVQAYLFGGTKLQILDGPVCSNDVSYFEVKDLSSNDVGWVPEAQADTKNYYLEPGY